MNSATSTNFVYGNGVTTTRSLLFRLQTTAKYLGVLGSIFSRTFTYTPGEDIQSLSGTGITNTISMTYDNLHRIKTYTGLSGSYAYDAVGTITNNIEGGGSSYGYGVRRPTGRQERLRLHLSLRFMRQHDCAASGGADQLAIAGL